jgi:hypothetical protein
MNAHLEALDKLNQMEQERDAALARVAELEAGIRKAYPEIEQGHRLHALDTLNALIRP